MAKPGLPQGTRDFASETVRKRAYIFNSIRNVFETYGFQPLETPAMENLETLMGKYGEEGDKLIFKILNNGLDNPAKHEAARNDLEKVLEGKSVKSFTERALRYDLTIPFARYIATNFGQLTMPFKRYQIQPVWRADRPQKGRYREFYQCDADVVGSKSLLIEAELANIYHSVFKQLRVPVEIKINSRKILGALAVVCGGPDKMMDITIAIDKLDKIGLDKVKEELADRGLNPEQVTIIERYLLISGSNTERLAELKALIGENDLGIHGIRELEFLLQFLPATVTDTLVTDFTLARGLNYYTGVIFEVKAIDVQIGSIGGGGRYDDLTGLFGVPNVPGVGISFGVDRIYDVLDELKLFPENVATGTKVLFFNMGEEEAKAAFSLMQTLREKGIAAEIYPDQVKFDKQFKYADKKDIPYAVIIGSEELANETCVVKSLKQGSQQILAHAGLVDFDWS
ncbi:histidine--tRNA ligase [Segetibacter sp. 3557_3]|uniref:histidine--tRNA ligase n=1 Tax=Segetibacter sp. 3557_3 TaxID=2547429 RepID=UPI001058A1BC|nr:histidine--tRNA ligase [Segetibacter sp. 3557_3]TDH25528.1 histidine--tRNA ligase [Segetibacter sp. 3557_3]